MRSVYRKEKKRNIFTICVWVNGVTIWECLLLLECLSIFGSQWQRYQLKKIPSRDPILNVPFVNQRWQATKSSTQIIISLSFSFAIFFRLSNFIWLSDEHLILIKQMFICLDSVQIMWISVISIILYVISRSQQKRKRRRNKNTRFINIAIENERIMSKNSIRER